MVLFTCTCCGAAQDSSRDVVSMPRERRQWWQTSTTAEYRCPDCRAMHALRLRCRGLLAYLIAMPLLVGAALISAPEAASGMGRWLGRVAYKPVLTMRPLDAPASGRRA